MTKHSHFMLHKPFGYLSQFVNNQKKRRNKWLLGELHDFPKGIMAIGRLDQKSEGLLLLTTDGKVSDYINSSAIDKEYYVLVDGIISDHAIHKLENGISITVNGESYITKQSKVTRIDTLKPYPIANRKVRDEKHGPTSWISVTINEGKFRQVRKMTAAVGFPTLRLVRVRVGDYKLDILSGEAKPIEL
ncbi:pseudouridine synthase [Winogradskyella sp. 3972H.M.0a.05]|uniref:pseudouridine synthase n=1 Tax=Winogradskyella sp. 3972H.M.0a.05 TaxID=2950277 RepID=UPI003399A9C0